MAEKIVRKVVKNEVVRFIFSAGAGFVVDMSAFSLFYHVVFKLKSYRILNANISNYAISFTISFFLGVMVNFLITKYVVFSQSKLAPLKQFVRFVSVAAIGYFANLALLEIFIKIVKINPLIARPAAALSLFFASYFIHKVFSFSLSLRHHAVHAHHK